VTVILPKCHRLLISIAQLETINEYRSIEIYKIEIPKSWTIKWMEKSWNTSRLPHIDSRDSQQANNPRGAHLHTPGTDLSSSHNDTYTLPNLVSGKSYVITVVVDNNVLDENYNIGGDSVKSPRGILNYKLSGYS
jgi:hypothetical protein